MADQWYYTQQGERKGPVSEDEVKRLLASGTLKPTALVSTNDNASWGPAYAVRGLLPARAEDEPPPLPTDSEPPPLPAQDEPPPLPTERPATATASVAKAGISTPPPRTLLEKCYVPFQITLIAIFLLGLFTFGFSYFYGLFLIAISFAICNCIAGQNNKLGTGNSDVVILILAAFSLIPYLGWITQIVALVLSVTALVKHLRRHPQAARSPSSVVVAQTQSASQVAGLFPPVGDDEPPPLPPGLGRSQQESARQVAFDLASSARKPRINLVGLLMALTGLLFLLPSSVCLAISVLATVMSFRAQPPPHWFLRGTALYLIMFLLTCFTIQCLSGIVGGIAMVRRRRYWLPVVATLLFSLAGLGILVVWQAARLGCNESFRGIVAQIWDDQLSVTCCRLLMVDAFWGIFVVPVIFCLLGMWSLLTLRNPQARQQFRVQADPLEPPTTWLLVRKLRIAPSSQNATRLCLGVVAGLHVLAFVVGMIHGATLPPYAHVPSATMKLAAAKLLQVLKRYDVEDSSQLPKDAGGEEAKQLEGEIETLLATAKPPPIEIDDSCRELVSDIRIDSAPKLHSSSFFGFQTTAVVFSVKFRARTAFNGNRTGLVGRTYGKDGTMLEESDIYLNTDAFPGEVVIGRFNVNTQSAFGRLRLQGGGSTLARAYRFRVGKKSEDRK